MAQCRRGTGKHKYVVLSITEGLGFEYIKNKLLRIVAVFEEKMLSSEQLYVTPSPFFNCNFTWRVEKSLLKRLQSGRTNIRIELQILEDEKEQSVGYATVGLRHAQYVASYDSPRYRCLELKGIKRPFGVDNPQIFVAVTIQTKTHPHAAEECHSTELEDPQDEVSEPSGNVCDPFMKHEDCSNKSQTNVKKYLAENVENKVAFAKRNKPIEQTESCYDKKAPTAAFSADTIATNSQTSKIQTRSTSNTAYPISKEAQKINSYDADGLSARTTVTTGILGSYISEPLSSSPSKALLCSGRSDGEFVICDDLQDASDDHINLPLQPLEEDASADTINMPLLSPEGPIIQKSLVEDHTDNKTCSESKFVFKEQGDGGSVKHIYKLEFQVKNTEWSTKLSNMKVLIKFYNPHCNSKVNVKNRDYYLPNLLMTDIICCMYYVSVPDELLEVIMYQPPQILFYKENNKLLARGTVKVTQLERQSPQSDIFEARIPITEKTNAIIGEVHMLVKFEDLGIPSEKFKGECLECVIKYQESSSDKKVQGTSAEDVISDLEQLSAIHEKLRQTYNKMNTCFKKMLKAQGLEHIPEENQLAQNKAAKEDNENTTSTSMDEANVLTSQSKKPTTSPTDSSPPKAKTEENVSNKNVNETFTQKTLDENEDVLWCEFCKQFHIIKKTSDYITAIEATDSQQLTSEQVKREAKSSNANKLPKQTVPTQTGAIRKLAVNESKKESHLKPYSRFESASKQKVQTSKESKHGNARSVKPTIQSKPRQMAYIPKPSITVMKRPCQGCEQYLEVGYGQRVWQDDELTFWCKDCCIRRLQSELKETMQNCTSEVSALKNQIKIIEDEYASYAANSVSKEKYEYLTAAQVSIYKHNLTMLFIHAKHQNEYLHTQCSETAEKLQELKQIIPQETPLFKMKQNESQFDMDKEKMKEIYGRICDLKQEIDHYRNKDNAAKQTKVDLSERVAAVKKPIIESEQQLSSRKNRCEACRIIHSQSKTRELMKTKTSQPSFPRQMKSVINLHKKDEERAEKASAPPSNFCKHEIRKRMDTVHAKLQHYLEERDELVRVNHYTCNNIVVSYMTKIINKLLIEWNELKAELEKFS